MHTGRYALPAVAHATVLEARFDPAWLRARPGLYAAVSGTPAYGLLRAMTLAEWAEAVGDAQTPDQRHVLTVRVKGRATVCANPQMAMAANYFVTVRNDYRDWKRAWWREAIQNAVDAGATRVDLTATQQADGSWLVMCADNGRGMDAATIVGKFLALGGTSKPGDAGAAGGFGKAKELLLLPWMRWVVHSRDTIISGQGTTYEVAQATEGPRAPRAGTLVAVRMAGDNYTYDAPARAFLEECDLPHVRFTVNGAPVRAHLTPVRPVGEVGGGALTLGFRPIKSGDSRLIVRTKGLAMFSRYLADDVRGLVIGELTRSSIELLTANRDGIRDWRLQTELDDYVNRLAADTRSALRDQRGMIRKRFAGEGKFVAQRHEAEAVAAVLGAEAPAVRRSGELTTQAIDTLARAAEQWHVEATPEQALATVAGPTARVLASGAFAGTEHVEAALKQLAWRPDFYVINEIDGYKVPRKFFPATMTPTVLKLAKVWTELCRYVLIQLNARTEYGVGLIFSSEALAACLTEEGQQWLLLNPFVGGDTAGKLLAPSRDADLKGLYASAIHECTHLVNGIDAHNEAFAAAFTHNVALCADGYRKIRRLAASIKMRGDVRADQE